MKLLIFGVDSLHKIDLDCFNLSTSNNFINGLKKTDVDFDIDGTPFYYSKVRANDELMTATEKKYRDIDILSHLQNIQEDVYDHIIATGLRKLSELPNEAYGILKRKMKPNGMLCEFSDGTTIHKIKKSDIVFTAKNCARNKNEHHIGWAADDKLFKPAQEDNVLNILIDHSHYNSNKVKQFDQSENIVKNLKLLDLENHCKSKFSKIVIRQISNKGITVIDCNAPYKFELFNTKGLSYYDYSIEMSRANIFIPTHKESLGLSVIEAGMAGCFVISHTGHIPPDRLQTVKHKEVNFNSTVQWETVLLNNLNHNNIRKYAYANNWTALAEKVITYLKQINR